jgi:hypothetical protein
MRPVKRFLRRLGAWATRQDADERLLAEIEDHLAHQTAEYERAGLSPAEARRQALLKFGGVEATRERWREERGLPALETIVHDTRHALRRLRMAPAFTIATVLVLAIGIGATTAIFTLVHAVLLKSLPVRDPGELYRLGREARCCYWGGYTQAEEFSLVSYQLFTQLRDKTPGFTDLAAFSAGQSTFGVRRAGKRASRNLSRRVRLRQLLRDVWRSGLRRAHADARRRSARRSARGGDELSLVDAAVRRRSVDRRQRRQSER